MKIDLDTLIRDAEVHVYGGTYIIGGIYHSALQWAYILGCPQEGMDLVRSLAPVRTRFRRDRA